MDVRLPKGYLMEELLRLYFIRSGHYTVRGIPFVYQGFEITDVDIWAYDRPSPVSRQRIIVDCKNRSTPKAIERIFWTKGLQQVLGVEQAIVATTDKRAEVAEFGREHGVVILDGTFLSKLEKSSDSRSERLTEEAFTELLTSYRPIKDGGDWKARVKAAKRPFATGLGFNAINGWINEGHFFAEQIQLVPTHRQPACRALYLMLSFTAIAFDFVLREFAFSESALRLNYVNDGLRHGSPGKSNTSNVLRYAIGLIEHYAPENRSVAAKVRDRLGKDLDTLATKAVSEYICKPSVSQELFTTAKELEAAAYQTSFLPPKHLSAASKAYLFVFADFWNIDRSTLIELFDSPERGLPSDAAPELETRDSGNEQSPPEGPQDQPQLPGLGQDRVGSAEGNSSIRDKHSDALR